MTNDERDLLQALAWMCQQYLGSPDDDVLDHLCMHAGERAVDLLEKYGLIEPSGRGGTWTEAGLAYLNRDFRRIYPPDPISRD